MSRGNVSCPIPDKIGPENSSLDSNGGGYAGSTGPLDSSPPEITRGTIVVDSELLAKASGKLSSSSLDRKDTGGKGGTEEVSILKRGARCDEPVTTLHMYLDSASAWGDAVKFKLHNMCGEFSGIYQDLNVNVEYRRLLPGMTIQRMSNVARGFEAVKHNNKRQTEELKKCHAQLESLKYDIKLKNINIENLQANSQTLEANRKMLETDNGKLRQTVVEIQRELCKARAGLDSSSYVDGLQAPFFLESSSKNMFSAISIFTSLYAKYKRSDGSLPARSFLESRIPTLKNTDAYTTRNHHWILMLKSIICKCLFMDFESETFIPFMTPHNTVLFLEPEERMRSCFRYFDGSRSGCQGTSICHAGNGRFDSLFLQYLTSTSSSIFRECPEISWLAHLPCMNISCGSIRNAEPNLVESFIIAAKKVWDFHKLCLSFEPPATIFRVVTGEPYNKVYMDSPVTLEDDDRFIPKVGFMIYPGFRLRKTVIKSQVYFHISD